MVNVDAAEGVRYGIRLLGYAFLTAGSGFVLMFIGLAIASSGEPFGIVLGLGGFLVLYAGLLGMGYKVIADGVEKGMRAANAPPTAGRRGGQARQGHGRQQGRQGAGGNQAGGGRNRRQ